LISPSDIVNISELTDAENYRWSVRSSSLWRNW